MGPEISSFQRRASTRRSRRSSNAFARRECRIVSGAASMTRLTSSMPRCSQRRGTGSDGGCRQMAMITHSVTLRVNGETVRLDLDVRALTALLIVSADLTRVRVYDDRDKREAIPCRI